MVSSSYSYNDLFNVDVLNGAILLNILQIKTDTYIHKVTDLEFSI